MRSILPALVALLFPSVLALGQNGPLVLGVDYARPAAFRAARGQVITVFVSGQPNSLSGGVEKLAAESAPLPAELGGVSVAIRQSAPSPCGDSDEFCSFLPAQTFSAPIFSVERVSLCIDPAAQDADCQATAVTLQVPIEALVTDGEREPYQAIHDLTELVVTQDGVEGRPFRLIVLPSGIHILNTCDDDRTVRRQPNCAPMAAHADGSLITAENPARFGETVVLYAYGLGPTHPIVASGETTPSPPPPLGFDGGPLPLGLEVYFDIRPNAAPESPRDSVIAHIEPQQVFSPGTSWAGLTPGFVGLYQINVPIPKELVQVFASCGEGVRSNLTINIGSGTAFDGAGICVDPGSHPGTP